VVPAGAVTAAAALRVRRPADASADPSTGFGDQLALLGGCVATVAIVWQALPTVVGY
jgi:hypothetical protein